MPMLPEPSGLYDKTDSHHPADDSPPPALATEQQAQTEQHHTNAEWKLESHTLELMPQRDPLCPSFVVRHAERRQANR